MKIKCLFKGHTYKFSGLTCLYYDLNFEEFAGARALFVCKRCGKEKTRTSYKVKDREQALHWKDVMIGVYCKH